MRLQLCLPNILQVSDTYSTFGTELVSYRCCVFDNMFKALFIFLCFHPCVPSLHSCFYHYQLSRFLTSYTRCTCFPTISTCTYPFDCSTFTVPHVFFVQLILQYSYLLFCYKLEPTLFRCVDTHCIVCETQALL